MDYIQVHSSEIALKDTFESDFLTATYDHLKRRALACISNKDLFKSIVEEYYFTFDDAIKKTSDANPIERGLSIDIHEIAEIIDESNKTIIENFYKEYEISENEIDLVISKYDHEIACYLDDWIEEILLSDALVFSRTNIDENICGRAQNRICCYVAERRCQ